MIELNRVLAVARDNAKAWGRIKQAAARIDPANADQRQLRKSLLAFKNYPSLCRDLSSHILSLSSDFCNISFLDETRADSVNEHDRTMLYREVANKLSEIKNTRAFCEHLIGVEVGLLQDASFHHIESQILCIYKYVIKLMVTFPNVEADYKRLYVWRDNFNSIVDCFASVEPRVAGSARRLREDVDREMSMSLSHIVPSAGEKEELIPLLLLLKKASNDISCWRSEAKQAIDDLLLSMSKTAANSGQFMLDVQLDLKNIDGADKPVALQILSEHKCFEGAMNAVFNSATARQGINYVIDALDISVDMQDALRSMYTAFEDTYKGLIEQGLLASKGETLPAYLKSLVVAAEEVAQDYSNEYRFQLISLTAHIFAYWSLKSMNTFVSSVMSNTSTATSAMEYLMRPHAAQVVAIWSLLNFQHKEYRLFENHFVEILTGEGKSIALGVTSIMLAMMDCDVVCVCYSTYLSTRDFVAFKSLFKAFGVLEYIKYSTVKDACNELYNKGGDTRTLSEEVAWRKPTETRRTSKDGDRAQVLLIDEVDVFFKDDFYGETYNAVTSLRHEIIPDLLKYVLANRENLSSTSLQGSPLAQKCISLFPTDMRSIVLSHLEDMLIDATKFFDSHEYSVRNGQICYKELDGMTTNLQYGYCTAFASIREYENGRMVQSTRDHYLNIALKCGNASYAEIPNTFDVILGVTGTLKSLNQNETDILRESYGIKRMTYIPSVYGNNKLFFAGDSPKGKSFF
jgi:hypothetical protein